MTQAAKNYWYTRTDEPFDSMNRGLATRRNRDRRAFTGKVGSGKEAKYYYRGNVWHGPTNRIGCRDDD